MLARCAAANVPHARVGRPDELGTDPNLNAGDGLLDVAIGSLGGAAGARVGLPALPMEFGAERGRPGLRQPPPAVGEDSAAILAEVGYAPAEIDGLVAAGVVIRAEAAA